METGSKTSSLIKKTALEAIEMVAKNYQGVVLESLNLTVDKENGIVTFFDPEENSIISIVIDEWMGKPGLTDGSVIPVLRSIVKEIDREGGFDSLELYKPFVINYTDENMFPIEEITVIGGEEEQQPDNELLEKFERDFDAFLDKLLKE